MKPLVGVNYFSGWWRDAPNKWRDVKCPSMDWREKYVNRIPLNGCFDDQETMDQDILTAEKYGIDFFQMLWYPVDSLSTQCDAPHRHHLNAGIEHFCSSPHNNRMRFIMEYCNHPPFSILDDHEWLETCKFWAQHFKHPSYLTIDGKALFKIHGFKLFQEQCGSDPAVMRSRLATLKEAARKYAQRDLIITAGIVSENISEELLHSLDLVDFYSVYMDLPQMPAQDTDYPYSELLAFSLSFAQKCADLNIPFMPYFPVGWNPRPWYDPRPSFAIPDGDQIQDGIIKLCDLIAKNPTLGMQSGSTHVDAFTMYAWNEFGEGGYLAPTLVEYDGKLKGLKQGLDRVCRTY